MLLATLGFQAVFRTTEPPAEIDDGSCPGSTPAGLAVLLFDFRKPVGAAWRARPVRLLRDVARELPPAVELRVYRVAGDAAAPLSLVDRLCVPNAGKSGKTTQCLYSSGREPREDGASYCDRLGAATGRIEELASATQAAASSAYLVEAIDVVRREFAGVSGHRSLHVLSDMMQHAERHSHLESRPEDWRLPPVADNLLTAAMPAGMAPGQSVPVSIYYVPRTDSTVAPEVRRTHQALWRERLAAAGFAPIFHDLPVAPAHESRTPSRLARLARAREDLIRSQARLADMRVRLDAAREGLRQARIRADQEKRALLSRRDELRAQDAAERERLSAERAESARLKAALASRAQDAER